MAKIYNDFQPVNLVSFAKSFARLNGQPLDKSEIWYSLAEAQAYAATEAAYVGQILAVIDTENNKVVFYGVQDVLGTLKEVGSTPVGDELSVEIVNGVIQLKGFGTQYYAYVPAVKNPETGEIIEPSKYVLKNGFKAGLEPRIVANEDKLVLAWYEPGTETVEDVAANIESVSKTVDELKAQVGSAASEEGGVATGLYAEIDRIDAELTNKPNATQVTEEIAAAIAGVDHLKREIVEQLPPVESANSNVIYMVPSGLQNDDNKYYEWILIDGIFERVGSWEVNLSNYATKADINTLTETINSNKSETDISINNLDGKINTEIGRATAAEKANADAIAEFKTDTNSSLGEIRNSLAALEGAEPNFISSVDGNNFTVIDGKLEFNPSAGRLITSEEVAVIKSVSDGAYENFIKSVDETELNVDNTGKLTITSLPSSKVTDLASLLNAKADTIVVEAIDTRVTNIENILTWKDL